MKNKRILIVANTTWNIYKFRLNVIQKFLQNDNEVFVAAPVDEYLFYKQKLETVTHLDVKRLKRDHTHPINDLLSIFELRKIYKSIDPDLIIHYTHKANLYGGIAAWLSNKKSVAVVTGLGYAFLHNGYINTITKFLYRVVKGVHRKLIFENEDDMNHFVDSGFVHKKNAAFVNGCGVDVNDYKPTSEQEIKNRDSKVFVFTFIGRLLKDKGIVEFLKAADRLKSQRRDDVAFHIIGEFDEGNPSMVEKDYLQKLIDLGTVEYLAFAKDIKPEISKSSCIVLPSYREGMPRVILEALSMAKPVITTDVPGCRQTVDDGVNGFLVKERNVESLILGMQKMLTLNDQELLKMGQNGREMAVKCFNSEKISSELYEIVSQVYFCAK